jgi:radial spoke head protein 1
MEGYGTYYYSYGAKYVGHWLNNMAEGYGTYYYSNGDKSSGMWNNDRPVGIHVITYKNGTIRRYSFLLNKFID